MLRSIPWHIPYKCVCPPRLHFYDQYYGYPKIIVSLSTRESEASIARYMAKDLTQIFHIDMNAGSEHQFSNVINCMHNYVSHLQRILNRDYPVAVAFELRNKQLITGKLRNKQKDVYLDHNQRILLTNNQKYMNSGSHKILYVTFDSKHVSALSSGSEILLDSGKIVLRVLKFEGYQEEGKSYNTICCVSETDGIIRAGMDVAFLNSDYVETISYKFTPSREVADDIDFALYNSAQFLVILYESIESLMICEYIRWALNVSNTRALLITKLTITKIGRIDEETLAQLFYNYSGVWIKSEANIKYTQREKCLTKKLMQRLIDLDKFIIWEGPLLEDPTTYFYPDCICIKSDDDPNELKKNIRTTAPFMNRQSLSYACAQRIDQKSAVVFMLTNGAIIASIINRAAFILSVASAGKSVALLATQRPVVPIIAVVKNRGTSRRLLIYKNVMPIYYDSKCLVTNWENEISARVNFGLDYARYLGYITKNRHTIVIVFDSMEGFIFADTYRVLHPSMIGRYYIQL